MYKKYVKEYWQKREGQSIVLEDIEWICFPKPYDDLYFTIKKVEHWQINKNLQNIKYATDYIVTLPGVSMGELINNNNGSSQGLKFELSDVREAFNRLIQNDLIEPEFKSHVQTTRYRIKDQNLRKLIEALAAFHEVEFNLALHKWQRFDEPTSQEKGKVEVVVRRERS
jgi:hypothetical protein